MSVTPSQFDLLQSALDAASLRQRVVSQNIANVNTPGYQTQEVAFEEELVRQLALTGAPGEARPAVQYVPGLEQRVDRNNVDLDREVAQLNKNAVLHETYTQLLATKLSMMRSAITGR